MPTHLVISNYTSYDFRAKHGSFAILKKGENTGDFLNLKERGNILIN